jgi:hypothetical protein
VLEGWVSEAAASDVYGVVLAREGNGLEPAIDLAATKERRELLRTERKDEGSNAR